MGYFGPGIKEKKVRVRGTAEAAMSNSKTHH